MSTENKFLRYLSTRYGDVPHKGKGHVITISREYGCFANDLSENLVKKINDRLDRDGLTDKWSVLSKEIINKSAEELSMNPEKISYIFEGRKKGIIEDIYDLLSNNYYVPDRRIINSIQHLIRGFALDGNVVIVGRASCVIAKDVPYSLHVKLIAPINYRAGQISRRFNLTLNQAREQVREVDAKREHFIRFFTSNRREHEFYDLIINRSKFDEDSIVRLVMKIADERNII